jgi:hypothetical protein
MLLKFGVKRAPESCQNLEQKRESKLDENWAEPLDCAGWHRSRLRFRPGWPGQQSGWPGGAWVWWPACGACAMGIGAAVLGSSGMHRARGRLAWRRGVSGASCSMEACAWLCLNGLAGARFAAGGERPGVVVGRRLGRARGLAAAEEVAMSACGPWPSSADGRERAGACTGGGWAVECDWRRPVEASGRATGTRARMEATGQGVERVAGGLAGELKHQGWFRR